MPLRSFLPRLLGLVLLGSVAMACAGQAEPTALVRLRGELDRLDGILKRLETQGGLSKEAGTLRDQIAGARRASSPSVLVYQLRAPYVGVEQLAFTSEHREAGKDIGQLEALWKERGPRFKAVPGPIPHPVPAAPLLAALAQKAANRAEKHYRAALPYGRADSPASGLYYLGEAEAQRSFGDFVSTLDLPKGPKGDTALAPGALQAALEGLEGEMGQSFAADPATQSLNGLSARLKEARELFERGSLEGAALALLESRVELSRQRGGAGAAPAEPSLAQAAEGSLLAPFRAVPASGDVVPFYRSFFKSRPLAAAAAEVVTVTLIRWPYT